MKKIALLLIIGLMSFGGAFAQAPCDKPWGPTPEDSLLNFRTYYFYQNSLEAGKIEVAYNYWNMILAKVPCARKDVYIDAPDLIDSMIARTEDTARKQLLIDSLYKAFAIRIANFGREGYVKGQWGVNAARLEPNKPKQAYDLLKKSVELEGNKTEYDIPIEMIGMTYEVLAKGFITREQAVYDFVALKDICIFNLNKNNDEYDDWLAVSEYVDEYARAFIENCDQIKEIFGPKLEANPDDLGLKNTILALMKAKKCVSHPLYIEVLSSMIATDPSEQGYYELASYYSRKKEYAKANTYLKEAINLVDSTDSKRVVEYTLLLASNSLNNSCGSARTYADKVLSMDPNNGKAMLIKGHAVYNCAKSGCTDPYWKKALSWVAVDYMNKAKAMDPTLTADANKAIASYKRGYPKKDEKFFHNHNNGDTVTIPCAGLTTTVK